MKMVLQIHTNFVLNFDIEKNYILIGERLAYKEHVLFISEVQHIKLRNKKKQ